MTVVAPPDRMTVEQFLDHPSADRHELVDGQMTERSLSFESAWIAGKVFVRLDAYAVENGGTACGDGAELRCFGEEGRNVRKPDASFVRAGRLAGVPKTACDVVPDVVVEVLPPGDRVYDVNEKLKTCREAGVPAVVVISPDTRVTTVHRGTASETVAEDETLRLDDAMPGFALRLSDVLPPPSD